MIECDEHKLSTPYQAYVSSTCECKNEYRERTIKAISSFLEK